MRIATFKTLRFSLCGGCCGALLGPRRRCFPKSTGLYLFTRRRFPPSGAGLRPPYRRTSARLIYRQGNPASSIVQKRHDNMESMKVPGI